jgi:hypothetical protein
MGIAGRSAGGRPLGRRREMVSIWGRPRLRGTGALQGCTGHRCDGLQASIDHRGDERMALLVNSLKIQGRATSISELLDPTVRLRRNPCRRTANVVCNLSGYHTE